MHEKMADFLVLPRIFNQTLHTDEISQEDDQNVIKRKDQLALFQVLYNADEYRYYESLAR